MHACVVVSLSWSFRDVHGFAVVAGRSTDVIARTARVTIAAMQFFARSIIPPVQYRDSSIAIAVAVVVRARFAAIRNRAIALFPAPPPLSKARPGLKNNCAVRTASKTVSRSHCRGVDVGVSWPRWRASLTRSRARD